MKLSHRIGYDLVRRWWTWTRPYTMGVRVLVVDRDPAESGARVCLVRMTYHPLWFLPGGALDRGETLEQAARREVREETGHALGQVRLFGLYTNFVQGRTDHVAAFASNDFERVGEPDHEIEDCAFFPLDALPPDTSSGTRRRVAEYRAGQPPRFARW